MIASVGKAVRARVPPRGKTPPPSQDTPDPIPFASSVLVPSVLFLVFLLSGGFFFVAAYPEEEVDSSPWPGSSCLATSRSKVVALAAFI